MPFYKNCKTLDEVKKDDISWYLKLYKDISIAMKNIHNDKRNIIMSDLNATNIIVDKRSDFHFVDIDSWSVDGLQANCTSGLLKYFLYYKNISNFKNNKNTDVLQLYLLFIYSIFGVTINTLHLDDFYKIVNNIETFKNLRSIILHLKNDSNFDNKLPYFDTFVDNNDLENKVSLKQLLK